jgi:flagella basal body P-ring formation protein FlgA
MMRIVIAFALLVGLGWEAAAATPAPRLRELVTVTSDLVRIGDLLDGAGVAADIPVFRAPDLGQTGSVTVGRIIEALAAHEITAVDAGGLREVVVTRLSRALTAKDIGSRIARAVAGRFGYGDAENLSVIVDRDLRTIHVEASATAELAVTRLRVEPRTGRFDIAFELPGSAVARRLPLRFTGTVKETVEAATLIRAVRAGEIVKASDVAMERRPKSELSDGPLSVAQAVGLAAKTPLRAGQALRAADLMRPQVVRRNESVVLHYEVPGITLTVRGKALETGAVGDTIGVLNLRSNRTIQASVTGPGRVAIIAARPVFAAAPPAATLASNDTASQPTP